ncbi:hypothetical protein QUA35_29490 [Microcoleus sp. N9_B2]
MIDANSIYKSPIANEILSSLSNEPPAINSTTPLTAIAIPTARVNEIVSP